jgi:hypothetical protein
MTWIEKQLRKYFEYKEIGWTEIGERFTRYYLLRTRWFSIFLHQLNAPHWHQECHDHPWSFIAILLLRGYLEKVNGKDHRRYPGSILWRPATFLHNVITPYGTSWSIILASPRSREWGFKPCEQHINLDPLRWDEYREVYGSKIRTNS